MFGPVAQVYPKPGQERTLLQLSHAWQRERGATFPGFVAAYRFRSVSHPREYTLAVLFTDHATYQANTVDPEQDRWYQQIHACLAADPEWNNGKSSYWPNHSLLQESPPTRPHFILVKRRGWSLVLHTPEEGTMTHSSLHPMMLHLSY